MCLDPRPDSLFRARRSSTRALSTQATDGNRISEYVSSGRATTADRLDGWLAVFVDDLDARGWTLVTRAVTC